MVRSMVRTHYGRSLIASGTIIPHIARQRFNYSESCRLGCRITGVLSPYKRREYRPNYLMGSGITVLSLRALLVITRLRSGPLRQEL
jgi:hypothetical protein